MRVCVGARVHGRGLSELRRSTPRGLVLLMRQVAAVSCQVTLVMRYVFVKPCRFIVLRIGVRVLGRG